MNASRWFLDMAPLACILPAILVPACSSDTSATLPGEAVTSLPSAVPLSCIGDTYYVYAGDSAYCSGGRVWFLCDGDVYSRYDCTDPGDGYADESGIADPDDSASSESSEAGTTDDDCTEVTFSGMDNPGPCGFTDTSDATIVTCQPDEPCGG
jgi:hypothetical protein